MAVALAGRGVRLVLSGRSTDRLRETAERARAAGAAAGREVQPAVEAGDLSDPAALDRLVARVDGELGGPHLLVHALGAYDAGRVEDTPAEALDRLLRVNLRAPYELTRRLLPTLRRRRGQVVFLGSSAALHPKGGVGPYAASKAALGSLAAALRDEVNPDGVRVLTVLPGRTASAMQEEVHRLEGKVYDPERLLQPADVATSIVHALELPRTAEVTEIRIRPAYPAT